jgi:predicted transcriptional regulator
VARTLRIIAIASGVVVLALGAAAWSMWPQVDDIPEQLEPISADVSVPDLELDAQGPLPAVRLGDLHGKTVYLMIEGKESMMGGEGKQLRRALHRWQLPDDVIGFSVGDAPAGAVVMRNKIESEFLAPMRSEMKLPIYIDFGGQFTTAFSLPKGHLGFVILDPAGEVVFRHAGDAGEAELAQIKQLLRAEEPPPGPPAPSFAVADISNQSCAGRECVLVFLDAKVFRSEIPGLEQGGFEGEMKESFEQIKQPSIRLARVLAADWEAKDRERIGGVVVGEAEGWDAGDWQIVPEAAEARAAFGIGDHAGMVIIDEQGRVAFSEAGLIPFWKLSLAADVLGITPKEFKGRKKKD